MNQKSNITPMEIAHFRFALIAPVIQGLFPDPSPTAYYRRITEHPIKRPDGTAFIYNYNTIERWTNDYRRGGMDALLPKVRSDKGISRTLSDVAIEEIYRLREKYPKINATMIHTMLVQESYITADVSKRAIQRFVKSNDLKSARNPNIKDRKAFEEEHFGCMWQADTCYLPYIKEDGRARRTYLVMIIDDHSRLIVGGQIFYQDNAYNFQKVLKQAVATYGIPHKLYLDNGSPYKNDQLSFICGSIGTTLLHTPVRDGAAKGKVERNFRTLRERWLNVLDTDTIHSLAQFNELLTEYIHKHNTTVHSSFGDTPLNRFLSSDSKAQVPKSEYWLNECFYNRITRKVRKDSCISIDGELFDVLQQFIGMTVEIRFLPDDKYNAYIQYNQEQFPIFKTDKNANCHTKRNNLKALDFTKKGDPAHE